MNTERKWYLVYTRARSEKKVVDTLAKRKLETFCPLNRSRRHIAVSGKKVLPEPLFKSFVFVRAAEIDHKRIRQVDEVINFVYWLGQPAIIRPEEIEAVRTFTAQYSEIVIEKAGVDMNEPMKIMHLPSVHHDENRVEVKQNTVEVLLPTLGYRLVATVDQPTGTYSIFNLKKPELSVH